MVNDPVAPQPSAGRLEVGIGTRHRFAGAPLGAGTDGVASPDAMAVQRQGNAVSRETWMVNDPLAPQPSAGRLEVGTGTRHRFAVAPRGVGADGLTSPDAMALSRRGSPFHVKHRPPLCYPPARIGAVYLSLTYSPPCPCSPSPQAGTARHSIGEDRVWRTDRQHQPSGSAWSLGPRRASLRTPLDGHRTVAHQGYRPHMASSPPSAAGHRVDARRGGSRSEATRPVFIARHRHQPHRSRHCSLDSAAVCVHRRNAAADRHPSGRTGSAVARIARGGTPRDRSRHPARLGCA